MGSSYPLCSFTGVVTTMNDSEAKAKERKIDVYRSLEIIGVRYRALLYFRYCFSVVCDRFEFLFAYLVSEETNTTPRVSRNCRGVRTFADRRCKYPKEDQRCHRVINTLRIVGSDEPKRLCFYRACDKKILRSCFYNATRSVLRY